MKQHYDAPLSIQGTIDSLRLHSKISAVWLAVLVIALVLLIVSAMLPTVLDAQAKTHAAQLDDLAQLTGGTR
jgi:hypothetical protein